MGERFLPVLVSLVIQNGIKTQNINLSTAFNLFFNSEVFILSNKFSKFFFLTL